MIPKVIHQIFIPFKGKSISEIPTYAECQKKTRAFCVKHGYTYKLYDEFEIKWLLCCKYKEYRELYKSFTDPIMKVDFARYLILHHYGGIYLDLDMYPVRDPIDLLTTRNEIFTCWEGHKLPYIAFLASRAGNPLYRQIAEHCKESFYEKIKNPIYKTWTGRLVFQTTGHYMLQRVLKKNNIKPVSLLKVNTKKNVVVEAPNYYFEDYNVSVWYQ